jgi:transposase-like protein
LQFWGIHPCKSGEFLFAILGNFILQKTNGVSTRKIERLAQSLGIENLSASQVSEINKGLNEQVEAFRSRPLDQEYPVLWIDAMYEKICIYGRVFSAEVLIVTGITVQEPEKSWPWSRCTTNQRAPTPYCLRN